jgi:hypothetical protein
VLFDQALVSGANFLTNILIARAFGLRDYGVFALAWMAVLFANSFQWAMVLGPMMSIGPKQTPGERDTYYGAVLLQEMTFASLSASVVFIAVTLSRTLLPHWNAGGIALPLSAATFSYLVQAAVHWLWYAIVSAT